MSAWHVLAWGWLPYSTDSGWPLESPPHSVKTRDLSHHEAKLLLTCRTKYYFWRSSVWWPRRWGLQLASCKGSFDNSRASCSHLDNIRNEANNTHHETKHSATKASVSIGWIEMLYFQVLKLDDATFEETPDKQIDKETRLCKIRKLRHKDDNGIMHQNGEHVAASAGSLDQWKYSPQVHVTTAGAIQVRRESTIVASIFDPVQVCYSR